METTPPPTDSPTTGSHLSHIGPQSAQIPSSRLCEGVQGNWTWQAAAGGDAQEVPFCACCYAGII